MLAVMRARDRSLGSLKFCCITVPCVNLMYPSRGLLQIYFENLKGLSPNLRGFGGIMVYRRVIPECFRNPRNNES